MKRFWHVLRILTILSIILLPLSNAATLAQGEDPPDLSSPSIVVDDLVVQSITAKAGADSVTITWQTAQPQTGWVEWGASWDQMASIAYDERGAEVVDTHHRVTISDVQSGVVVYYTIVGGDERFDNGGSAFKTVVGGERFEIEMPPENVDAAASPEMQAAPIGPAQPTGVTETALDASQFVIEWQTAEAQTGWVEYGASWEQMANIAYDERGAEVIDTQHRVILDGLEPGQGYYYVVVSGGERFDNGEAAFKFAADGLVTEHPLFDIDSENPINTSAPDEANDFYVVLDAGHGGNDPGAPTTDVARACGVPLDLKEKDRTLDIAQRVRNVLQTNGVRVGMTRDADTNPSLLERSNYINRERPNLAVSIHANSAEGCGDGVEAWYSSIGPGGQPNPNLEASRQLAQRLASKINQRLGLRLRRTNGIADGNFHMVREPVVPSALIEMAFISNATEAIMLRDRPGDFAAAIAAAIMEHLGINPSDPDDNRTLTSGQTLNGTINPASDQDTYYFDGAQGQRATIRMNRTDSGSLDSYLYLYAPNGSLVAQDDDSGGSNNSLINQATLPQNGRYRIVVQSWNNGSTGTYSLRLDIEGGAGGCTPGANGVILYEHHHAGRCVTFTGDHNDFNVIGFNDIASSIRFVGSYASGWEAQVYEHTYYGGVSSTYRGDDVDFGNDTIGHDRASSIRIRRISNDEPNDRFISSGQTLNGVIDPASDQDSFVFDASQGQRATIRMNRTSGNLDSFLYLYAPNGSLVTQDDDSGGNFNSLINQVSLPQNGRYRIIARSYNGSSTGGYSLGLELGSSGCTSNQYRAEYYNNRTLSGSPTFTRCEGWPINQDWGGGGPGNGVGNDNFSARWTGRASINAGRYTFIARADDGIRVWFDNILIIDAWRDQGPTEYRHTRDVSTGMHDIRVEYYENSGGAVAQFRWEQVASSGNIAANKTSWATSQQSSSYPPRNANDGSMSTRWSSQISSTLGWQWFKVDLGSAQTFDRFVVRWEAAYGARYWVAWCDNNCTNNDNSNWRGFERRLSSRQDDVIDFGNETHRYIGVLMIERAPQMQNYSIWEFEAYNRPTLSAEETPETTPELATPTELPTPVLEMEGALIQN